MSEQKVRIGFVGVGTMGQCAHLRNYASLRGCQVVALAEVRPRLAAQVAAKYGVPKVYKDHVEMLAAEKLDGIVASQPFNRHGVLVPELYKADVPVLTEKPLGHSVEAGEKILQALKSSKARHMVGYHKRSDPATVYAKAAVDAFKASGELGRLRYVRIVMPPGDWIAGGFFDLLGTDERVSLPGDPPAGDMDAETFKQYIAFVNYYIHQVNLLRHLLGENYKVSYADPSGVLLAAHSDSGVCGTIEMAPYRTTVDWQESALVAFEKGYVKLELPAPLALNRPGRVEILKDPGGKPPIVEVPHLPMVGAMRQQAINFVKMIRGEAPAPCEATEALEDLKVARQYIRLWKGQ